MPKPPPVLVAPALLTEDAVPVVEGTARGLLGDTGARLVVDLDSTTFVSSAGLSWLLHVGKRLADRGGILVLARPKRPVVKLLRAVGLGRVLPAFDDVEEAVAFATGARVR